MQHTHHYSDDDDDDDDDDDEVLLKAALQMSPTGFQNAPQSVSRGNKVHNLEIIDDDAEDNGGANVTHNDDDDDDDLVCITGGWSPQPTTNNSAGRNASNLPVVNAAFSLKPEEGVATSGKTTPPKCDVSNNPIPPTSTTGSRQSTSTSSSQRCITLSPVSEADSICITGGWSGSIHHGTNQRDNDETDVDISDDNNTQHSHYSSDTASFHYDDSPATFKLANTSISMPTSAPNDIVMLDDDGGDDDDDDDDGDDDDCSSLRWKASSQDHAKPLHTLVNMHHREKDNATILLADSSDDDDSTPDNHLPTPFISTNSNGDDRSNTTKHHHPRKKPKQTFHSSHQQQQYQQQQQLNESLPSSGIEAHNPSNQRSSHTATIRTSTTLHNDKAHSRQIEKLERQLRKKKTTQELLNSLTILIDPQLAAMKKFSGLEQSLRNDGLDVGLEAYDGLENSIWWRRDVQQVNKNTATLQSKYIYEPFLVVWMLAKDLVRRIEEGDGLNGFVNTLKEKVDPSCQITLIVEGLEAYFQAIARTEHNHMVQRVTGHSQQAQQPQPQLSRPRYKNRSKASSVNKVMVEHVLVWLQMDANMHVCTTSNPKDTISTLSYISRAVATSTTRSEGQVATLFNPQVRKAAKVDSKSYAGINDLWTKQLMCFPGVSLEIAHVIASKFPSPRTLSNALCHQGLGVVADLVPHGRVQRIGEVIASRLLKFLSTTQPHTYVT